MAIKPFFFLLFYSLLFLLLWGLLFLSVPLVTRFSVFIGLVYTHVSCFYVRDMEVYKGWKYRDWVIMIGPCFYLVVGLVMRPIDLHLVFDPIVWGVINLVAGMFLIKELNWKTLFFVGFFCYVYAYHLYRMLEVVI